MKQLILLVALGAIVATRADADPPDSPTKQAADHFDRGVAMYGEADYRAALVEFKKAYEIAPNAAVLYNLGQTYYQLQNYAEALSAFEQYIALGGGHHRDQHAEVARRQGDGENEPRWGGDHRRRRARRQVAADRRDRRQHRPPQDHRAPRRQPAGDALRRPRRRRARQARGRPGSG